MTIQIKTVNLNKETLKSLERVLLDENQPLPSRFNSLFQLKAFGTNEAIDVIQKAFVDASALLKHEVAYVLGQMHNPYALDCLYKIVADDAQDSMTRHEAAEAIGAIGQEDSIRFLASYCNHQVPVIRETCILAIDSIKEQKANMGKYSSIDPAPPLNDILSVKELEEILLDTNLPLFKRYRAMFSLRDLGTDDAVIALAKGFHDSSALFRHEIAYVFGQMQSMTSIEPLITVLKNVDEIGMVRHEAAEALGSIGTEKCKNELLKYVNDKDIVVRESCLVGLGMLSEDFVTIT
jgi:deoxyhypusine monooxygenase